MEYNNKNQVPDKYKINLQDFFKNEEAWENKLEKVKKDLNKLVE